MQKQTQDFILLIFNCQKYRYKAEKQREKWLLYLPSTIVYYHVIGDLNLQEPYIINKDEHLLTIKVNDDYLSLPKKVISAYEIIYRLYNFKYIFKTDDDQFLNSPIFFNNLMMNLLYFYDKQRIHYGGKLVNVNNDYVSEYYKEHPELPINLIVKACSYCNGRFYLLSSDIVGRLVTSKKAAISEEYFEDYAIGYNIPKIIYTNNFMPIDTDAYFKDFTF